MNTGQELVLDLAEQLNTIKLPLMALKLDELYRSPGYPAMDKLDFLSALLAPEFRLMPLSSPKEFASPCSEMAPDWTRVLMRSACSCVTPRSSNSLLISSWLLPAAEAVLTYSITCSSDICA